MNGCVFEKVDITDVVCPTTFIRIKEALEGLANGLVLQVHLNDGEPFRSIPGSIKNEGHQILKLRDNHDGTYELYIKKMGN